MRTFLKQQLTNDGALAAAYSLESVLIELVFIAGPMLVAMFVAVASPGLAVCFSAACGFTGTLMFLHSPALRGWRIEPRKSSGLLGPLSECRFLALLAVILCYSTAFGLVEIGITGHATESGNQSLAGVLLGLMSAGSAVGGLVYGSRSWHFPLARQFAAVLLLMAGGLFVLTLGWEGTAFAVWCTAAGVVMAPALIMQSMLVARTAGPDQSTEAFTWSSSALLGGVGLGFAAGGGLLEYFPSPAAFAAAAAAALTAAALARLTLRRDSN
jgi:hypothetical protein